MKTLATEAPPQTLWSLATLLPGRPASTFLSGIEQPWVPGLESTSLALAPSAHDAAVVVANRVPDIEVLRSWGRALRPGSTLVLAVRSGVPWLRSGFRRGASWGRVRRSLRAAGFVVVDAHGLRPGLRMPEFVVSLEAGVTADFWGNQFRPWSRGGAIAAAIAARVPAIGRNAFPWLVVSATWTSTNEREEDDR